MSDEQEADAADEQEPDPADAPDREAEDASAEADEAADDGGEEETGIQDGDVIEIDYTLRTVEDDRVIDTTDPELAEQEGLDEEGRTFEPRTLVLGEGQLFESVQADIRGREVGGGGSVVVPAAEAFGEYDPDEVETVSTDRIPEDSRFPGAQVEIDGRQGMVEAVYSGRSRVDFNHPLAGEDVEYEYEVVDVVEDRVEQAKGMLSTFFEVDLDMRIETDEVEEEVVVQPGEDDGEADEDAEPEMETEVVEKETLYIESSPQLQFDQQWMFSKQQIAQQLMDVTGVDRVIIQEVIEGQAMGMPGMMGGGGGLGEMEEALEEADLDEDVDAEELVEELEGDDGEGEEVAPEE